MSELYWITRLDTVNVFLFLFIFIIGCFLIAFIIKLLDDRDNYKYKEDEDYIFHKRIVKKLSILISIMCLLFILVPTERQALLIWGVGGTIDYIKSNDTAKQLPDKCVKALDKFIDEYVNEDNNNKDKKEE